MKIVGALSATTKTGQKLKVPEVGVESGSDELARLSEPYSVQRHPPRLMREQSKVSCRK